MSQVMPTEARVEIYPALGIQAIAAGAEVSYVTTEALRTLDPGGSGRVALGDALRLLVNVWGLRHPHRRLERAQRNGYLKIATTRDGDEFVFLTARWPLHEKPGLGPIGHPHLVRLLDLRRRASITANLYASIHELPGHAGEFRNGERSRTTIEQLTGVSPSSQRRYEHYTCDVEPRFARVHGLEDEPVARVGCGYFVGSDGRQRKQLANRIVPRNHWPGSRRSARRAASRARAEETKKEPPDPLPTCANNARGERQRTPPGGSRRFYRVARASAAPSVVRQLRLHIRDPIHLEVGRGRRRELWELAA